MTNAERRTTDMWSQRDERGTWMNFAPHPETCRFYDESLPVHAVIVSEGTDTPDCHWGWWDNEEGRFTIVYPFRVAVAMCFPYGPEIEEKMGRGHILPVTLDIGAIVPRPARPKR